MQEQVTMGYRNKYSTHGNAVVCGENTIYAITLYITLSLYPVRTAK